MFGWDFEDYAWSRFWRWDLIRIFVWTCHMNSTLGSVVPLAMFHTMRSQVGNPSPPGRLHRPSWSTEKTWKSDLVDNICVTLPFLPLPLQPFLLQPGHHLMQLVIILIFYKCSIPLRNSTFSRSFPRPWTSCVGPRYSWRTVEDGVSENERLGIKRKPMENGL